MNKISLKVPSLSELDYRKQILADSETMAYNAGYKQNLDGYNYDTGIIKFTDEKWQVWFNAWVNNEPKKYYAYIMLDETPIGEVALHYDNDFDCHLVHILLESDYRGKGYSEVALRLLMDIAFNKLKLNKVADKIPLDRKAAIKTFIKVGFKEDNLHINDIRFGKKEQSNYFELTKIRYLLHKK